MRFDISNSWALGYDGLSWGDLGKFENELRFALKSVQRVRSKLDEQTSNPLENSVDRTSGRPIEREGKSIAQSLQDTAQEINTSGSLAIWLNNRKSSQRKQLQSPFVKAFFENVKRGHHNLKPMEGLDWRRHAAQSMLWLVFQNVSFAHALLVLCSFPKSRLDGYSFEDIVSIVEYVAQNRDSLYCEALEAGAEILASTGPPFSPQNRKKELSQRFDLLMTNSTDYQAPSKKRKRTPSLPEPQHSFDCNGLAGWTAATFPISTVRAIATIQIMPELSPTSLWLLALFAAFGGVKIPSLLFERFSTCQVRGSHIAGGNGVGLR